MVGMLDGVLTLQRRDLGIVFSSQKKSSALLSSFHQSIFVPFRISVALVE